MVLSQTELAQVQVNHIKNMIGIACMLDAVLRGQPPKSKRKHVVQVFESAGKLPIFG